MSFLRKNTILLGFSAATAIALAIGCSQSGDESEGSASNLNAADDAGDASVVSQPLVISQIFGGGGNTGSTILNDYVELFNNSNDEIDISGKTVQYTATLAAFTNAKNVVTIPDNTKLASRHYFLIQLSTGGTNGAALDHPDYVATQPLELIAMSKETGKVALVASKDALLNGCGAVGAPCDPSLYLDLVGYGSGASQFRGSAPAGALGSGTAAIRRLGGCANLGDNSTDFDALPPAPRNSATTPETLDCATVDAAAPPAPDAGGHAGDGGTTTKKDGGASTTKKDAGKGTTAGDDDDDDGTPVKPDGGAGDDDDDDTTPSTTKKPTEPSTTNGVTPPAFPATAPDCNMSQGHNGSTGFAGLFGLAFAAAAMRRRKR